MLIANPIYDTVFKYMMDDNKVAKLLISAIIGVEIVELDFKPTEYKNDFETKTLTVFRIDFSAKVKTTDGTIKTVVIEVQKAKFTTDIMRFRKYLGSQYIDKANSFLDSTGHRKAFPIVSIYFLGHRLTHVSSSIVKVSREYIDCVTKERLTGRDEFIESLTHDSYIIQVPELSHKRRNELEQILSIFDQTSGEGDKPHVLDIDENSYPEKYRPLVRALVKAISEPKVRRDMEVEDEIVENLENLEHALAEKEKALEEERRQKEEERRQKEEERRQKVEERRQKEEAKAREEEERRQKEVLMAQLDSALKALIDAGHSEQQARHILRFDSK